MDLRNKVALITGAAVRLGKAMSLALAARGVKIALHYRFSQQEARHTAQEVEALESEAFLVRCDLSRAEEIRTLSRRVEEHFGRIDILINNAAVFYPTPLGKVTEEEWDTVLDVNLRAPFLLCQEVARLMLKQKQGKIINLADISVWKPWKEYLPYCISKTGMVALTQGLARALAPHVQVNAIAPGTVLPPIDGRETLEQLAQKTLLGRVGSPRDIVSALLFLLEGSDFVTGQVIVVDGGRVLK